MASSLGGGGGTYDSVIPFYLEEAPLDNSPLHGQVGNCRSCKVGCLGVFTGLVQMELGTISSLNIIINGSSFLRASPQKKVV